MKITTANARLAKLNLNKNTNAYRIVSDIINGTNNSYRIQNGLIRPCYTSGSGRYSQNAGSVKEVTEILDALKIKYITGNDSPRGGHTGNWIKIATKITA